MSIVKHLLVGLMSVAFVCGIVLVLTPTTSDADFFKKKSFPQAPLIKKGFHKTVCGFRNPRERFVTSKDGTEVCDRNSGNIWEQNPDSATLAAADPSSLGWILNVNNGFVFTDASTVGHSVWGVRRGKNAHADW